MTPFTDESVAFSVLERLGTGSGSLKGLVALDWLDDETDKLKTASIVSYGLKSLVKTSGTDSLFALWTHEARETMVAKENATTRDAYITFCVAEIDKLLIALRRTLPSECWKVKTRKDGTGLLTTTTVNALLILLRKIAEANKLGGTEDYLARLNGLSPEDFWSERVTSSQYGRLAQALFDKFFAPDLQEGTPPGAVSIDGDAQQV